MRFTFVILFIILITNNSMAFTRPDSQLTPGKLCTVDDPNFSKIDYPEQIARCNRNVSAEEKRQVAKLYGDIPKSEWGNYEFDHLIPLCVGGSNDIENIWPQPIDDAHGKDKLENEICNGMKAGSLSQQEAVQRVHDWFSGTAIGW